MSLFNNIAQNGVSNGRAKKSYSLDEILVALDMQQNGVSKEDIASALSTTVHSLNYKIFEKQAKFKDGVKCRSIMKYLYVDHTDLNSELVDGETFAKRLFEAYGEEYKGESDVESRINSWCDANDIQQTEVSA